MNVYLEDGTWFCFGCGESGDAQKFVKKLEQKLNGLNDLQAYQKYLKIHRSLFLGTFIMRLMIITMDLVKLTGRPLVTHKKYQKPDNI